MRIIHPKRIFLWHTARNILAIFYVLQLGVVNSCGTAFDDVQSKAIVSQIVIVGRITRLDLTHQSLSTDYKIYTGIVQVLSVIKQLENQPNNAVIQRKQYITISGFLNNNTDFASLSSLTQSSAQSSSAALATLPSDQHCLSPVNKSEEYILFINTSSSTNNQDRPSYHNAQLSSKYTKTAKKLIKEVICENCATIPNAKSKRNLQVTEGAFNYKIDCRVEGNPAPDVRWYKGNEELTSSIRGIAIKRRRRKNIHSVTIRIKTVNLQHSGVYRCVAKNLFGNDTAKTRLTVTRNLSGPKVTPPPPPSDLDWGSVNVDDNDQDTIERVSHYIPCTGRDRNYCLHGGECQVFPDGRYKHCRCLARFSGARCEEANIVPPTAHIVQPTTPGLTLSEQNKKLVSVVIALAAVLAILLILLLIVAFYCAGWRYRSQLEKKRLERYQQSKPTYQTETLHPLDTNDSKFKLPQIKQCQSMAKQTEPAEANLQHPRRSLNLENYFPHSSSDVVLRRKSFGTPSGRPASQPSDRRTGPTRSRLSATSTIVEKRRTNDSEFDVLPERTPSSASIELDVTRSVSSCDDNSHPAADCDHQCSSRTNSLYISESTLDTDDCDRKLKVRATIEQPQNRIIAS